MDGTDAPIAERFKEIILPPYTREFSEKLEGFKTEPMQNFANVLNSTVKRALAALLLYTGKSRLEEFSDIEIINIFVTLVSAFNAEMPLDYPYIAALVTSDEKDTYVGVLRRQSIPGSHDFISKNIVPVCNIKNGPLGPNMSYTFTDVDVAYFGDEDELPKL